MNTGRTRIYAITFLFTALMLMTFAVARVGMAEDRRAGMMIGQERPPENIFFTIKNEGNFTTLVKAIEAAGLVDTLKGPGPFTLFAPTDAAFAKLPPGTLEELLRPENKEKLKAILAHHILPERVMSSDMTGLKEAKTLKRTKLKIDGSNGFKIDDTTVVQKDVLTSNGVIHVIDTLLMPK